MANGQWLFFLLSVVPSPLEFFFYPHVPRIFPEFFLFFRFADTFDFGYLLFDYFIYIFFNWCIFQLTNIAQMIRKVQWNSAVIPGFPQRLAVWLRWYFGRNLFDPEIIWDSFLKWNFLDDLRNSFIHSFNFFAADGAVIFFIIHFSSLWSIFFVFWYDCYYYFIFLVLFSEFEKKKKWIFSCFWGEKMRKLLNLLSNLNICCFFPLMPWHNCKNLWCLNYFLLIGFAFCLRIFFWVDSLGNFLVQWTNGGIFEFNWSLGGIFWEFFLLYGNFFSRNQKKLGEFRNIITK